MATTQLIVCSCLDSQTIDRAGLARATGLACSEVHRELCGKEAGIARRAIAEGGAIIACRQEQAFFEELADELEAPAPALVDIRDRAGWSGDTRPVTAKMAALVADAMLEQPPTKTIDVESAGVCLIIGEPETALGAARHLCAQLSVTVLLAPGSAPDLDDDRRFDVVLGRLRSAKGALGAFEVVLDGFQERIAGGRGAPAFTEPRDGARSDCDLILDLSGGQPLFAASARRDGYLRADPGNRDALLGAILEASQSIGVFEKPLHVRTEPSLCAHSRARQTGCTRCLDHCPTGAITAVGDHVAVDPMICAGCGNCSAVCPSGAISYDAPPVQTVFDRLRTMAGAWRELESDPPRLLVHDAEHGAELIRLSARYGRGLPADMIPIEVSALAAFGHAEALAALGAGFADVTILLSPKTEREGLPYQVELANALAGRAAIRLIEPAEPDAMEASVWPAGGTSALTEPVLAMGSRRQVTRLVAKALNETGAILPLPAGAPYGALAVDVQACSLCLSCVSLCPSGALADNPDRPQLRFQEEACLQCGLCANVCPERAITLMPRMNLTDQALSQVVLHEEEPFACVECGKPFGVRSTIMRVTEKLAGKHAMFSQPNSIRMIQMCDDCRVKAVFQAENNPFAAGERPRVRTTADYLPPDKTRKH
ncbi:MAG: 4Fe-4S binding protein [Burkholderiaceae bacterium]